MNKQLTISLYFIGLMFSLPFVVTHHRPPVALFYSEWIGACTGFLGLIMIFPILRANIFELPRIAFLPIGLMIIILIQTLFHHTQSLSYSLMSISYLGWGLAMMWLGFQARRIPLDRIVIICSTFVIFAGIFNAVFVLLQYGLKIGIPIPLIGFNTTYGAISQANHLASFTSIAIASTFYLAFKQRLSVLASVSLILLFLLTLEFTGSRSVWLYFISLSVLTFLFNKHANKALLTVPLKQQASQYQLFFLMVLIIPAFWLLQIISHNWLADGAVNMPIDRLSDQANSAPLNIRTKLWYDCIRIYLESPWFGIGWGNLKFASYQLLSQPDHFGLGRVFEHSHNVFIHLLTELGPVGLALIITAGVLLLKQMLTDHHSIENWWIKSVIAIISVHSLLEYPLWYAYFLGSFCFLCGLLDYNKLCSKPSISLMTQSGLSKTLFYTLIFVGLINLATLFAANWKLEHWLYETSGDLKSQKELDWITQYSLMSPYTYLFKALAMEIDDRNMHSQLMINTQAIKFNPMPKIAYQHALLLQLNGKHSEAQHYLKLALKAYPRTLNHYEARLKPMHLIVFHNMLKNTKIDSVLD